MAADCAVRMAEKRTLCLLKGARLASARVWGQDVKQLMAIFGLFGLSARVGAGPFRPYPHTAAKDQLTTPDQLRSHPLQGASSHPSSNARRQPRQRADDHMTETGRP